MPGPKSTPNPAHKRDKASQNRKTAKRMERRVTSYESIPQQQRTGFTKPGSENRNK